MFSQIKILETHYYYSYGLQRKMAEFVGFLRAGDSLWVRLRSSSFWTSKKRVRLIGEEVRYAPIH